MNLMSNGLWNLSSPVWLAIIIATVIYGLRFASDRRRAIAFAAAMFFLAMAFLSPLGVLADGYLFSAHMTQHLLLLLIIPLFLTLSLPDPEVFAERVSPQTLSILHRIAIPTVGWIAGLGTMWFWHIPSLCNAATEHALLGFVRSGTFLMAGMLFWWPVYGPVMKSRLPSPAAMIYLFSACLGCTLLGIYITFSTVSVCPAFANPTDRIGILTMLYKSGFTPRIDQQLAGLLMWVPPCMLYVGAILSVLRRWFAEDHPTSEVETPPLKGSTSQ